MKSCQENYLIRTMADVRRVIVGGKTQIQKVVAELRKRPEIQAELKIHQDEVSDLAGLIWEQRGAA